MRSPWRLLRRIVGLALLGVVLAAAPAGAHTVTGVEPTNYRSQIVAVTPPTPVVEVSLLDLGRQVELTNTGTIDVVVLGYEGEPYLRVGPSGVYENAKSPTLAANRVAGTAATTTTLAPPSGAAQGAAPPAAPEWKPTGSGRTVRWRDHRTRWEGPDPPAVRAAPESVQVVSRWDIQLRQGETPLAVSGRITWVPGPNAVPWLLLALGLAVATAAAGWTRWWGWWLSAAVALMVAFDMVITVGSAAASEPGFGGLLGRVLLGGFISVAAWVVGILAVNPLQRQRATGLFAGGLTALILTLYTLPDGVWLGRSQLPYSFPAGLARVSVASVLGLGLGVIVAVVVVFKRNPSLRPESNQPG